MSVATAAPPTRAKKKRGRESAGDMVRSLGLILLIVVPVWFFAQPPSSDQKTLRTVDPAADIASFAQAAPGVPVPGPLPAGWRATSSTLQPGSLRVGWVTPSGEYAEYDGVAGPAPDLAAETGSGAQVGTFDVDGVTYRQLRDGDGHTSLVRVAPGGAVVVGGVRQTSTLEELRVLAAAVR